MDTIPIQLFSAVGVIVAALIGGFLSLLSLVTSKDQKVSDLRYEWITAFRDELATLLAELNWSEFWAEEFKKNAANAGRNPWTEDAYKNSYLTIAKSATSLRLRLNRHVEDASLRVASGKFLKKLDEVLQDKWTSLITADLEPFSRELRELAAQILSSEWKRIEQGESGQRTLKKIAIGVLIVGVLGVVVVGAWLFRLPPLQSQQTPIAGAPQSGPTLTTRPVK
jgi:hypothetical protein